MTDALEEIVLRALYEEMQRIRAQAPTSRWFLFGSITTAERPLGDIDLLVVCKTTANCATVRVELAAICARFPIHLLLMTSREEAEVKFIQSESAVEITPGEAIPAMKKATAPLPRSLFDRNLNERS
jgi:predicted nucleotidyltransferase